jgi:hypothetical protein
MVIPNKYYLPTTRNGRIFEMINESTSNLLKHLEKTFSVIKLLKKQNSGKGEEGGHVSLATGSYVSDKKR